MSNHANWSESIRGSSAALQYTVADRVQASLEVFVSGSAAQQPNNERLYRFWVQKCAHIANAVPSSIGEMAEQIWRCTHGAYAVASLSPAVPGLCVPHGQGPVELSRQERCQHQCLVVESMRKHLLPRMLSCAFPALSIMPEGVLNLSLQDLCQCVFYARPWAHSLSCSCAC